MHTLNLRHPIGMHLYVVQRSYLIYSYYYNNIITVAKVLKTAIIFISGHMCSVAPLMLTTIHTYNFTEATT